MGIGGYLNRLYFRGEMKNWINVQPVQYVELDPTETVPFGSVSRGPLAERNSERKVTPHE